jgi:threonine dehydrogenase-like Zn-dependent dehydrogenase
MVRGRKKLLGAYTYDTQTWSRVITLLASDLLDVEAMITHKLPLNEAEEGFQLAINKEAAKVVFTP